MALMPPAAEIELDTRGLQCPLPVLRARKAMQKLAPGAVLRLLATDPGTVKDVRAFCQAAGPRAGGERERRPASSAS